MKTLLCSLLLLAPVLTYGVDTVKKFTHNSHNYLCFDDKFVVHDPDCAHCATQTKVAYKVKSPDIDDDKLPWIIMNLDRSPYRNTYFPGLYFWMED